MGEYDLRSLQLCELDLLKELDRICKKHGIAYFLGFGTALGAVRHQGFIPWDDDIDVMMPYTDYLLFQAVCRTELPPHLFYQDWHTDPAYFLPWAKLRNSRTASLPPEMADYPINWGVCIDIFPLFPVGKKEITSWQRFKIKNIVFFTAKPINDAGLGKYYYENPLLRRLPKWLCRGLRNWFYGRFCKTKMSPYLLFFTGVHTAAVYPSEWFAQPQELPFEGIPFPAPADWDAYLTQTYGDYRKIPDEADRITHGDLIVDLENSYEIYRQGGRPSDASETGEAAGSGR